MDSSTLPSDDTPFQDFTRNIPLESQLDIIEYEEADWLREEEEEEEQQDPKQETEIKPVSEKEQQPFKFVHFSKEGENKQQQDDSAVFLPPPETVVAAAAEPEEEKKQAEAKVEDVATAAAELVEDAIVVVKKQAQPRKRSQTSGVTGASDPDQKRKKIIKTLATTIQALVSEYTV